MIVELCRRAQLFKTNLKKKKKLFMTILVHNQGVIGSLPV